MSNTTPQQMELTAMPSAGSSEKHHQEPSQEEDTHSIHPLSQLTNVRKHVLLAVFCLCSFIDVTSVSGVAIAVADISADIGLQTSQVVWIITSYSLCFSAFLLFSGRLSDLYPAGIVFNSGFLLLGVFSLVVSFVTSNKYGFLILRGLGGISGSLTIPSAYHLCIHMFPEPKEQANKLALLGLAGGLGNVFGLVIAGLCMEASYKWFFRVIAILCFASTAVTLLFLPHTPAAPSKDGVPKWRKMDVPGVVLIMGFLICLILSLTQGPIDGWGSASFIAPFIICWPLAIGFFYWESKIPPATAILPSTVWSITNAVIASLAVLVPMAFWGTSQLLYANYWQLVFGWKPLHVSAAMLPQGVMTLIVGALSQVVPAIINKPRWTIPIGAVLIIIAEILQIKSNGGPGKDYWRYVFPASVIGSAGAMGVMFASSINFVQSCPPEAAGVGGAWTQVLFQIGGAVALAVQAGMEKTDATTFMEAGGRAYYFIIGWTAVICAAYTLLYKTPKSLEIEHEEARQRMIKKKGEIGV
ncbi:hypothetical protein B9479_005205 [Cryptococcus floricola]|uniref:Major facilitator superfamily (MFS) profile domain-containing protein n=1 Tax=Cryptococcus floricola TaxID=2591691 RepID=A0A5D3AV44_9TREE|nr:hypothetical protein B9479_005205 [Cryptococcus floricola]